MSNDEPPKPIPPPTKPNPSGMWCPDCRAVGMYHCSDPQHCDGMQPLPKECYGPTGS